LLPSPTRRSSDLLPRRHRCGRRSQHVCPCHFPRSTSNESTFYDLFCSRVPNRHSLVEIGVIGQMTADRRIVAKDFVLDNRLSTAHCFEKIGMVIGNS